MIFSRWLLATALLLSATLVHAQCDGTDLRPSLTPQEWASVNERLETTPYAEGNVWRATRGAQTFHVIGTMHLDDPRFDAVMTRLAPLVRSADLLLLEATAEEMAKLERAVVERPDLLFITTGPTLPDLLPEKDWKALAKAAGTRGFPAFLVAKMQPWYLSLILTIPGCAMKDVQSGIEGLDQRLMDYATRAGVPQQSLEPFDTLFDVMSQDSLEDQARLLTLGVLSDEAAEDSFATLKESYFEQKSAETLEVNRIVSYRHVDLPEAEIDALTDDMLDKLLARRNLAWMTTILSAPEGVTVIAAGAAHLPGTTGLLALLEAEGFVLTRSEF